MRITHCIAVLLLLGQAAAQLIGTSCPGLSVNTGLNQEKGVIVDGWVAVVVPGGVWGDGGTVRTMIPLDICGVIHPPAVICNSTSML